MAEEEVTYASVVIKNKREPQIEAKLEDQIVYDEVRLNKKTVKPSDATDKKAGGRRCCQLLAFGLMAFCIISMLTIIGVLIYEKQNLKNQVQELQMENKNLTKQVDKKQTFENELNVSRAQWSIDAYCPKASNVRKCAACQDGWSDFQSSCYAYNDAPRADQLSWEEARGNCRGKISDLTEVSDEEEKNYVSSICSTGSDITGYWIGLRAVEGKWKWVNGSDMTDNNWINPPTNDNPCVISIKDKGWKPVSCENKNAWICEKKALSV